MKILHTADWHLGKVLQGWDLQEHQRYVIDQLIEVASEQRPDVVLLAGDIYDRSAPAAAAVALFDHAVYQLTQQLGIPIIAVAGNHDNAERLHCYHGLLQKQGLHIYGKWLYPVTKLVLKDEYGPVHFYPFAYTDVERFVSEYPPTDGLELTTHAAIYREVIRQIQAVHPKGERAVFIGHCFVQGGVENDSYAERPISLGGAERVPLELFDFFNYTALGHLHAEQGFLGGKVRYSSSLLKYSFSEISQQKSVALIQMDSVGQVTFEPINLKPKAELRRIKGIINAHEFTPYVIQGEQLPEEQDMVEVTLTANSLALDAVKLVRQKYPQSVVKWEYTIPSNTSNKLSMLQVEQQNLVELFKHFFEEVTTGETFTVQDEAYITELVQSLLKPEV